MTTEKCQPFDAVDFLLLAGLVTLEALLVLTVALVALLLALASHRRPSASSSSALRARWRPSRTPAHRSPSAPSSSVAALPAEPPARKPLPVVVTPAPAPELVRDTAPGQMALTAVVAKAPPMAPLLHPLALLAAELEALPVTHLRPLAGVTSKRHRKHELVAGLVAC